MQRDGRPDRPEHAQGVGEALHPREAQEGSLLGTFCTLYIADLPVAHSFCSPGIAPYTDTAVRQEYFFYFFQCIGWHS